MAQLPPLAGLDELERRLPQGRIAEGEDEVRAGAALEDASTLVRAEAGVDWVDDAGNLTAVPDPVVTVVCAVAARAMNTSFRFGADSETGPAESGLFLKATERALIRSALRPSVPPVGVIRMKPWCA